MTITVKPMPLKEVLRLTGPKRKGHITPHKATWGSTGVSQKAEEARQVMAQSLSCGLPWKEWVDGGWASSNKLGVASLHVSRLWAMRVVSRVSNTWPWGELGRGKC